MTLFFLTVQFPEFEITNGRTGDPHVEHVTELRSDPFRGKWIYNRGDQNSVASFLRAEFLREFCGILTTCHITLHTVHFIRFLHNTRGGNQFGGSITKNLLQFYDTLQWIQL